MRRADKRGLLLRALGMALCVVPVTVAILSYFPLWLGEGTKLVSGLVLLLLALAHAPLLRYLKRVLSGPSSLLMWLVLFVSFFALARIADEMTVISFTGLVSNGAGALCFRLAGRRGSGDEGKGE